EENRYDHWTPHVHCRTRRGPRSAVVGAACLSRLSGTGDPSDRAFRRRRQCRHRRTHNGRSDQQGAQPAGGDREPRRRRWQHRRRTCRACDTGRLHAARWVEWTAHGRSLRHANLGYDPLKDFVAVALTSYVPHALILSNKVQAKTMTDLIAASKTTPVTVATSGIGSATHMTLERLKAATGANLTHVLYRGGGALMPDL